MNFTDVTTISTRNFTSADDCSPPTWGYRIRSVQAVGYCLAFTPILTTSLNVVTMACILKAPKLKTPTRMFLFSLALCDALVGAIVLSFRVFGMITADLKTDTWMDDIICDVGNSLDVMLCTSSMMHLSLLAFDRFLATCKPFQQDFWFGNKRSVFLLVLSWLLPCGIAFGFIPSRLYIRGVERQFQCLLQSTQTCQFMANKPFSLFATCVCFILPGTFILTCNFHTMKSVVRRIKVFDNLLHIATKKRNFDRRHFGTKLARTIFVMTVCFLVCWMPFFVLTCIDPFTSYRVPAYAWLVVTWLGYANSAINPVLYLKSTGHLSFDYQKHIRA